MDKPDPEPDVIEHQNISNKYVRNLSQYSIFSLFYPDSKFHQNTDNIVLHQITELIVRIFFTEVIPHKTLSNKNFQIDPKSSQTKIVNI